MLWPSRCRQMTHSDQSGIRRSGVTAWQRRHQVATSVRPADATKTASRSSSSTKIAALISIRRRCGASAGGCQFHRVRAGWTDIIGRLSRRRREGIITFREARPCQDGGRLPRRGILAEIAPRQHWRKLGAIGFCFGGGIANLLTVRMGQDLAAGVPFYATPNPPQPTWRRSRHR